MCKQITLLCNFLISQWCRNLMDTGLLYTSTCFCPNEFHLLHRKEKWFLSNFEYGMFLGVFWTVLRFLKNGPKKGRGGGWFQWAARNSLLMKGVDRETSCEKGNNNSNNHSLLWRYTEMQKETTPGATLAKWEQETKTTIHQGSQRLDNRQSEKHWLLW